MSTGFVTPASEFTLDDLDFSDKKSKTVKPPVPACALPLRSKSGKKSKSEAVINVDEDVSMEDLFEKVESLISLGAKKFIAERDAYQKELMQLNDLKKISAGRADYFEAKNKELEHTIKDMEATCNLKVKEVVDNAKRSATRVVLQSRIKMAEEAKANQVDLWSDELPGWEKKLFELNVPVASTSRSEGNKGKTKKKEVAVTSEDAKEKDVVETDAGAGVMMRRRKRRLLWAMKALYQLEPIIKM